MVSSASSLMAVALSVALASEAVIPSSPDDYYRGLHVALDNVGCGRFWDALAMSTAAATSAYLLDRLYADESFTLYAPVDAAWSNSTVADLSPRDNLGYLLSYHVVQAAVNSTTVAPSRLHTIAFTLYRSANSDLPGNQTQAIVLQSEDQSMPGQPDAGRILIRGDTWNATSIGSQVAYANVLIQPIDKVLAIPSSLIQTLSSSGLAILANMGATSYIAAIQAVNSKDSFASCHGCTFFVPVNRAFEQVHEAFSGLGADHQRAVLLNHVLNGTVVYSPQLLQQTPYVTAGGMPMLYLCSDDGGSRLRVGRYEARIVRSDIPVSNGVVHLIDTVMLETVNNPNRAWQA
ncbi:hypothetical protein IAU60_000504 [Kwoniella sp. DSM 27419]